MIDLFAECTALECDDELSTTELAACVKSFENGILEELQRRKALPKESEVASSSTQPLRVRLEDSDPAPWEVLRAPSVAGGAFSLSSGLIPAVLLGMSIFLAVFAI